MTEATRALEAIERNSMILRKVTLWACVLGLAAILTFGIWDRVDAANTRTKIVNTLNIVKNATDPNSKLSQQGRAEQAQVVEKLIVCIEANVDRRPTPPGCP